MRRLSGVLLAILGLALGGGPTLAQGAYPNKTIRVLIPYAPGGLTDVVARYYGEYLRKTFGQTVLGDFATGDETGIGRGDVLGEEFSARDLDVKVLFEAEHDVQEVDRLGSQIADQRGGRRDFIVINPQRVDECLTDLFKNLFTTRHGFLPW